MWFIEGGGDETMFSQPDAKKTLTVHIHMQAYQAQADHSLTNTCLSHKRIRR